MKTIFIPVSKDIMRRNILDTTFWSHYRSLNPGVKTVLIVENGKKDFYQARFGVEEEGVYIEEFVKYKDGFARKVLLSLIRNGIRSHSTTLYRWRSYQMKQVGLLMTLFKSLLSFTLARTDWYKSFLRYLALNIKQPVQFENMFDSHNPDMIFALSLIDTNVDAPIAIIAKQRDIPVIGMVRSWDNLNNHGLLSVIPDIFLLQNKWLERTLSLFQGINVGDVDSKIVGLPHYDIYKNPANVLNPRNEFLRALDLDPEKKLIYITGFDFYFSEDRLPALVNSFIEDGVLDMPSQVFFTQHPSSPFKKEDYGIENCEHVTYYNFFCSPERFLDTDTFFINLMSHADVVINVTSTVSIDCAVLDRPAICINFDSADKKLPKWQKVERLFDHFDHYEQLVSMDGVDVVHSSSELKDSINRYLHNPEYKKEGRRAIVDEFVAPFDGGAGCRLAEVVSNEITKI